MSERRFNENELAEILRSAAEAQARAPGSSDESVGYSIGEIERLAAEVGIDPKHVGIAAQGLTDKSAPTRKMNLFGGPIRQTLERTIDGTLDDIAWEDVVSELRNIFGSAGTASAVGTSREWCGGTDFRAVHVSLTPRNGQTRVRVIINRKDTMAVAWISSIILCVFASITLIVNLTVRHVSPGFIAAAVLMAITFISTFVQQFLTKSHAKDIAAVDKFMTRTQELTGHQNGPQTQDYIASAEVKTRA